MVPLTSVPSEFAGRVLVAKLGSAGIIAEVRGVSRVYPTLLDAPHVWVEAPLMAEARELIAADLDDAFPLEDGAPFDAADRLPRVASRSWLLPVVAAIVLAGLLLVTFARLV